MVDISSHTVNDKSMNNISLERVITHETILNVSICKVDEGKLQRPKLAAIVLVSLQRADHALVSEAGLYNN